MTSRYLYGQRVDQILARWDAESGDTSFHLTDRQGSVRQNVDGSSGVVVNEITYDAFGNILSETNPTAGDRFKYTGREWESLTGLRYHRARWIDPATAQWLNPDPISFASGQFNLTLYVGNSPTNATDPSGLDSILVEGNEVYWIASSQLADGKNIFRPLMISGRQYVGRLDGADWVKLQEGGYATLGDLREQAGRTQTIRPHFDYTDQLLNIILSRLSGIRRTAEVRSEIDLARALLGTLSGELRSAESFQHENAIGATVHWNAPAMFMGGTGRRPAFLEEWVLNGKAYTVLWEGTTAIGAAKVSGTFFLMVCGRVGSLRGGDDRRERPKADKLITC